MAGNGPEVTGDGIAHGLRELGVSSGDVILVHSSLSSFGRVIGGADAVIDSLLDAVGPEGTVMVPTHTWDRIKASNPAFDVRTTECYTGRIPEAFRKRPGALRSLHPTHSCAAIGPMREALLDGHETQVTSCGSRSPYERLIEVGGKIVFLGVTLRVNTSFHALEGMASVPYLFDRFEMLYVVDSKGRKKAVPTRRQSFHVPRDFAKMEPVLEREGVLVKGCIGQAEVRVVDAAGMARVILPLLAEDPFLLLRADAAQRERARYQQWGAEIASGRDDHERKGGPTG